MRLKLTGHVEKGRAAIGAGQAKGLRRVIVKKIKHPLVLGAE